MTEKSHFLEAPFSKKISIALILAYLALQIYFELSVPISYLEFNVFLKLYYSLRGDIYNTISYATGILLALSGFLLLGISKYEQRQYKRISANLLIVLGLSQTSIDIVYNKYVFVNLLITYLHGTDTLLLGFLAAVTFLVLGKSLSRKRARLLIYLGTILLFLFGSFTAFYLVEFTNNNSIVALGYWGIGGIGQAFIYGGWVPWLLYFLAFMFIPRENKETTIVFEK